MRLHMGVVPLTFVYDGKNCPPTTIAEDAMLASIDAADADLKWAEDYLANIDPTFPYTSRL